MRVLRPGGVCVVVTTERKLMERLCASHEKRGTLRLAGHHQVDIGYLVDLWRLVRL